MTTKTLSGTTLSSLARNAAAGLAVASIAFSGCSRDDEAPSGDDTTGEAADKDVPKLSISGIPDQDLTHLSRQHELLAEYIAEATGLETEYVNMVDYAALVTSFERGDIQLSWFGALTGVQARALVEDSRAIVHRERDAGFRTNFIAQADIDADSVEDLKGLTFTFASESSTSGHLSPRYFLSQNGLDPDSDFDGPPNFAGSHDRVIELVQSGAYQAGAVSEAVWEDWVEDGRADTDKVKLVTKSHEYFNYNWSVRGDLDEIYGEGMTDTITEALLALDIEKPEHKEILDMFQAQRFVPTQNENYADIEEVARSLGLVR